MTSHPSRRICHKFLTGGRENRREGGKTGKAQPEGEGTREREQVAIPGRNDLPQAQEIHLRVFSFNQLLLLFATHEFDFLFACDGTVCRRALLVIQQFVAIVFARKRSGISPVGAMFRQTPLQVVGNTRVECSPSRIGDNTNVMHGKLSYPPVATK